jgi:hypothetical protein
VCTTGAAGLEGLEKEGATGEGLEEKEDLGIFYSFVRL